MQFWTLLLFIFALGPCCQGTLLALVFCRHPRVLFSRVTSPARSFLFQRHLLLVKFRKLVETCSFSQSSALWVPAACLRKTDHLLIPPQPDVVVQEQVFHPLLLVPSVRQGGSRILQLLQVCRHTYGLTPSEQTMELTFCRSQGKWHGQVSSCPHVQSFSSQKAARLVQEMIHLW